MIQNLPPRTVPPEPRTVPADLPHHHPRSAQCLSNPIECISNYRIHAPRSTKNGAHSALESFWAVSSISYRTQNPIVMRVWAVFSLQGVFSLHGLWITKNWARLNPRNNTQVYPHLDKINNVRGAWSSSHVVYFLITSPARILRIVHKLVHWSVNRAPWLGFVRLRSRVPEACFLRYGKFLINQRLTSHAQVAREQRL